MSTLLGKRLQAVLENLDEGTQSEVLDFAEFLAQKRITAPTEVNELSEEEHARIIAVLNTVAALSKESGPTVNNREHDA